MKRRLTFTESLSVGSLLFGLFFGAGNLIFPALMGQAAGRNIIPALIGFLLSGVGLPLLAVAALGISHSSGVLELGLKVGKKYSYFFTCALYLTIGPFFAASRCFTVPFETGFSAVMPEGMNQTLALFIFTFIFFVLVLFFSLRPGKILIWVGKFLNPLFLLVFAWIIGTALLNPMGNFSNIEPTEYYNAAPLAKGLLEGYNTMDTLAGLAFGIIVINVIRSLGINEPNDIAVCTVVSGSIACILMAIIYSATVLAGAQSRNIYELASNGGIVLSDIARHYFSDIGAYLLAAMIFIACLKTAIGLITSCSQAFEQMFPKFLSYRKWAVIFSLMSFAFANIGLAGIIKLSIPVLMMLYPLSITLIFLVLAERYLKNSAPLAFKIVTAVTFACGFLDFCSALPDGIIQILNLEKFLSIFRNVLPFFSLGLGWLLPAFIAFIVSILISKLKI